MQKIAIAVHGGAGPDSEFIRKNTDGYKKGIEEALRAGYAVLKEGGSSLDAVEAAVNYLEDNPLFNAGRGAALNERAEVEMDASIMNGKDLNCGAVSIVKNVKNPVTLARAIMEKTGHIYLGDMGALDFARQIKLKLEPEAYFITDYAFEQYREKAAEEGPGEQDAAEVQLQRKGHGTVGAVAVDKDGNVAAATSTGGVATKKAGRIGDSSIIGIGSYADNRTCAVSSTGDGELLIQHITAFHISAIMKYKGLTLSEACRCFFYEECKDAKGDMGVIAVDPQGNVCLEFKAERMHRGWISSEGKIVVSIYRDEP